MSAARSSALLLLPTAVVVAVLAPALARAAEPTNLLQTKTAAAPAETSKPAAAPAEAPKPAAEPAKPPAATSQTAKPQSAKAQAPKTAVPKGFGNIPFGTPSSDALSRNNGNGKLAKPEDGPPRLTYTSMLGGLEFRVVQNFDAEDRASDAKLTYSSKEKPSACVDRFNYVLANLTGEYGLPTSTPAMRREANGGNTVDKHTFQFSFRNRSGIRAELQTTYPTPAPAGSSGGQGGAGGGSPSYGCQFTLHYLPPGWVGRF